MSSLCANIVLVPNYLTAFEIHSEITKFCKDEKNVWNCLRQGCPKAILAASGVYASASVCKRNRRWAIFTSIGLGAAGQKKTFRVTRQRSRGMFSAFPIRCVGKRMKIVRERVWRVGKSEVAVSRVFLAARYESDISMQERTVGWEEDRYFRVIFKIIAIFLAVAAAFWWPYDSRVTRSFSPPLNYLRKAAR